MNIIRARVLDATHLELIQPIAAKIGDVIEISIPDDDDENRLWKGAAAENFLLACDTADSIYDNL